MIPSYVVPDFAFQVEMKWPCPPKSISAIQMSIPTQTIANVAAI